MHRSRALLFRQASRRAFVLGVVVASCMAPVPTRTATQDAPATPEATRPGSPTPAQTLAATDPPLGAAWQAASGLGDADIFDIARGPLGWVAAGTTCDDCSAAAWFSEDGLAWSGGAIPNDGTGTSW